ncbi:MAG: aconitate hydratase [Deltaproteobacteria bacterium]|nr:aconitate hydratase [Deltaproteobacteria bacterium]
MEKDPLKTTSEMVKASYHRSEANIKMVRQRLKRPFTLAEKILFGHVSDPKTQELSPWKSILKLKVDRVCMQDATAQMAMLQFMQSGRKKAAVKSTIHCDHLIQAYRGAKKDIEVAIQTNQEVYDFLKSAAHRHGVGFWGPGSGIIHQVFLENYAFPGGLVIGTDSHTPNAGGLCMVAIGVGGADAAEVMAGSDFEVLYPKLIGIRLTGELQGWASPKDVILKVCEILTTSGGTNAILEYFGPGTQSISATGKATITNMGAELGATTSVFPYDAATGDYLKSTKRSDLNELASKFKDTLLMPDPEVFQHPEPFFDRVIDIHLSELEPYVVGPHSPDVARSISKLKSELEAHAEWPKKISTCLIGSCTNSSYEDLSRVVDIAEQARRKGLKVKSNLMITPGSEMIYETIARDGFIKILESVGGVVMANACGPCIGQWRREEIKQGQTNTILTSYNRNFPRRNDGNPQTLAFIASPEIVMAMSFAGDLSFNPLVDALKNEKGEWVKFDIPKKTAALPSKGFSDQVIHYFPPTHEEPKIVVKPDSERLQVLEPFAPWDGKDFLELPVLLKAKGKCTTDHISPAGPWLKYRGHLDKISDNMFMGAVNAFTLTPGTGINIMNVEKDQPLSGIAREYKTRRLGWAVIGDENYGEGSSREHAAMSPRHLGCLVVIVRSFARIHETNLKKQGILPLVFTDSKDYDKIRSKDFVSLFRLKELKPGSLVECELFHSEDNTRERLKLRHSMTAEQIEWFKSGSAMNYFSRKSSA